MLDAIKKSLKPFDYILLIIAVWMFSHFNYSDLSTVDIVYMVTFTIWFIMLVVRTNIYYQGGKNRR